MKTLITADLHLSANSRDAYRLATMKRLRTIAGKKRVERTIILGDLTEEKDRHSDYLTNQVVEVVRSFTELGPVLILQGNHDSYSDPDCPFFGFLRHMQEVRWFGRPTAFELAGVGRTLWLPHARDFKKEWAGYGIDGVSVASHDLIFAHGMFVGSELGNGRIADGGIPRAFIPSGVRCIAGDIHIPQRHGSLEYVGAPYTIDFGDAYLPRAIVLEGGSSRACQTDIPLDHLPQKKLLDFNWSERELDQIDGVNDGDILKIRVALPRKAAPNWPEVRDELRRHWEKRCQVHSIVPVVVEAETKRVRLTQAEAKDDDTVYHEFARSRGLDKRTIKQGNKLL